MKPINPDAVLIAPDRCTPYLQRAVDTSLRDMASGAVLEVPCPNLGTRVELAEWCLRGGRRVPRRHHERRRQGPAPMCRQQLRALIH